MLDSLIRDSGQSALSAFRADIHAGRRQNTPADEKILVVAAMLRQASLSPSGESAQRLLEAASAIATEVVGPRRIARGCHLEEVAERSPLDIYRLLAELCEDRALYHLDQQIIESLAALAPPDSLVAARIEFRRIRQVLFFGNLDQAEMQFEGLSASRHVRFDEIRLRCLTARAAVARMHGNLPASRELSEEVLRQAGNRFVQLRAQCLDSIATILASKGDFSEGLERGWHAYQLVAGSGWAIEAQILSDIAIMVLDAGYPAQARPAIASLLHNCAEWNVLPLVGAYTEASSKLGDRAGVEWGVSQTLLLARRNYHVRHLTQTLFECALALKRIGEDTRSDTIMRRTLRLAERHGFHDFAFRAQQPVARVISPLAESAVAIAAHVQEMQPGVHPETLEYAT